MSVSIKNLIYGRLRSILESLERQSRVIERTPISDEVKEALNREVESITNEVRVISEDLVNL